MGLKVYLDGANIAHEDHETIRVSRIKIALNDIQKLGFESHALLPNYLVMKVVDLEIVKELLNDGRLSLISNDDDEALITVAYKENSFVLTNDKFRNHKKKKWYTPCKLNDLFGNGKNAAKFLESRGFPVRDNNKNNFYVKGNAI